jgi:hypothetical protein
LKGTDFLKLHETVTLFMGAMEHGGVLHGGRMVLLELLGAKLVEGILPQLLGRGAWK